MSRDKRGEMNNASHSPFSFFPTRSFDFFLAFFFFFGFACQRDLLLLFLLLRFSLSTSGCGLPPGRPVKRRCAGWARRRRVGSGWAGPGSLRRMPLALPPDPSRA